MSEAEAEAPAPESVEEVPAEGEVVADAEAPAEEAAPEEAAPPAAAETEDGGGDEAPAATGDETPAADAAEGESTPAPDPAAEEAADAAETEQEDAATPAETEAEAGGDGEGNAAEEGAANADETDDAAPAPSRSPDVESPSQEFEAHLATLRTALDGFVGSYQAVEGEEVGTAFLESQTPQSMYDAVSAMLAKNSSATSCSVAILRDPETLVYQLAYEAEPGPDPDAQPSEWGVGSRTLTRGEGFSWGAIDDCNTVTIPDVQAEGLATKFFSPEPLPGSVAVIPIGVGVPQSAERVVGVLTLELLGHPNSSLPADDIQFAQAAAKELSRALYQAAVRSAEAHGTDPPPEPEPEPETVGSTEPIPEETGDTEEDEAALRAATSAVQDAFEQQGDVTGDMSDLPGEDEEDEDPEEAELRRRQMEEEAEQERQEEEDRLLALRARQRLAEKLQEMQEERVALMGHNVELQRKLAHYLMSNKAEEAAGAKEEHDRTHADGEERYYNMLKKVSELRAEHDKWQSHYERLATEMKARLSEKEAVVSGMTGEFVEFRRQVALGSANSRTGKAMSGKLLRQFEASEAQKEADLEKVRLKNIHLRNQLRKVEQSLRRKEELSNELHLIDFEQLKIENQTLNEKIEERNEELLKLRKKTTTTVQVLTHLKEKLQFVQAENQVLKTQLAALEAELATHRDTLTRTKHDRDLLRHDNTRLRSQSGLIGSNHLLRDYDRRKKEVMAMTGQLHELRTRHQQLQETTAMWKKKAQQAGVSV